VRNQIYIQTALQLLY